MARTTTYHSKIYRDFKEIESNEFQSIVRFYESYETEIRRLDFSEYFELLVSYIEALFEVGAYRSHALMVDHAVELTILNNIKFYNGRDIYYELLFKKSASCFHLMKYDEAEHILRELIKINPYHDLSVQFLKKCLRRKKPPTLKKARAISIALFLATALIIAIEVLFVRTLFEAHSSYFEVFRNITFIGGLVLLVGSDVAHRAYINSKTHDFVENVRIKKGKR